jgi:hypothetical protein
MRVQKLKIFLAFCCLSQCFQVQVQSSKEVIKDNGEMTERSPVKEGNVVNLGEAE